MASGSQNSWSSDKEQLYEIVLEELGEFASRAAIKQAILRLKWRPEPSELREITVKIMRPIPSASEMWTEFHHKCIAQGYERPNWTDPLIAEIVTRLGGWKSLRSTIFQDSDRIYMASVRKRFDNEYESLLPDWTDRIASQIAAPDALRDPALFPAKVQKFVPAALISASEAEERPITADELYGAMPEHMKERFARLRQKLGEQR